MFLESICKITYKFLDVVAQEGLISESGFSDVTFKKKTAALERTNKQTKKS